MTCCLRCIRKLAQPEHSFFGGSAGVTTCTILHVSLKWTWEIYSTPQLRVLRKHFEEFWIYLCLEYGVALSNFHSFLFSGKWDAISCGSNGWGCQLKERDCRTQWGASSSHCDPRGILESIHGYRMSKVPQDILDVWSFFHYLAYDPKPTPFGQRCLLLDSCFSEKRRKPSHSSQFKSQKCRINLN